MDIQSRDEIEDKVESILVQLGIKSPPINIESVAKLFSVTVVMYPDFPEKISGSIIRDHDSQKTFIGVNPKMPFVRRRFTIAHELGHFLMGHDDEKIIHDNFDRHNPKEKEANMFAAAILMPRRLLEAESGKKLDIPSLARKYGVSDQAMSIRLLETNLLLKI